jgi:hypothetical protein
MLTREHDLGLGRPMAARALTERLAADALARIGARA